MFGLFLILNSIAFFLSQLARIKLNNGVAFTLLDLTVLLTMSIWLVGKILKKERISGILLFNAGLFIAISLLSLLANTWVYTPSQIGIASLYLCRFIAYFTLYLVVRDLSVKRKEIVKNFMFISGCIIILFGFIQYIFYPDLKILYLLGWDEHLYRMFSSFLDPNYLGSFLILFFLFVYQYKRTLILKKDPKILIILALIVLATILTYSRSAIIMGITAIGFYFIITKEFVKMALIIFLFLFTVFLLSNFYIEGLNPFRIASTQARIESAQNAFEIAKDHPVLGIGFNTYRYAQDNYGFRNTSLFKTSHADAGTDNSFLFILVTTGIIGLTSYLLLLRQIFSIRRFVKKNERTIFLTTLVALIVGSFFNNLLFYTPVMAWMWVYLGLMENR